jgi:hypothetical protein
MRHPFIPQAIAMVALAGINSEPLFDGGFLMSRKGKVRVNGQSLGESAISYCLGFTGKLKGHQLVAIAETLNGEHGLVGFTKVHAKEAVDKCKRKRR